MSQVEQILPSEMELNISQKRYVHLTTQLPSILDVQMNLKSILIVSLNSKSNMGLILNINLTHEYSMRQLGQAIQNDSAM
jgi:hypothetical protein